MLVVDNQDYIKRKGENMNNNVSRTIEKWDGSKWTFNSINRDAGLVYEYLSNDLIAKKINKCTYIKSIRRYQNYDGTATITVLYNNNCRALYVIADH